MDKKTLYLDNAATTYPKPPQVARAVAEYIANIGVNVNRGEMCIRDRILSLHH